jgi:hypothetical protein
MLYIDCGLNGSVGLNRRVVQAMKLLLVVAVLASSLAGRAHAESVGLKEFRLGMTLDEIRKLPLPPESDDYPGYKMQMVCSSDKIATKLPEAFRDLSLSQAMGSVGVVKCGHYLQGEKNGKPTYSETALTIANGPFARVDLLFTPAPQRLFYIRAEFGEQFYQVLLGALRAKYGEGTAFYGGNSGDVLAWTLSGAQVYISEHSGDNIHTGVIEYADDAGQAEIKRLVDEAAKKAASDL